jgi:hypothetical protein
VYGRMKKVQDSKADDIDRLLKRFPNLRVAYIDEVRSQLQPRIRVLLWSANTGHAIPLGTRR